LNRQSWKSFARAQGELAPKRPFCQYADLLHNWLSLIAGAGLTGNEFMEREMEYEIRGFNDDADERLAERARMQASVDQQGLEKPVFIGELVAHFREHELVDLGDDGKAYSTRNRCNSVLNKWVLPRWQSTKINEVRTIEVEKWLRGLFLARGTKAKIRKTLGLLFNHGIRWEFTNRNPISGPVRGSGVRQSEKRERIPEVLAAEEFRRLEAALGLRERVLLCLALSLGLRRGELAGLRWHDIDFEQLTITVQRSLVDQIVGRTKTEASQRPLPMDPRIATLLLQWRSVSKYVDSQDYIFATNSNRAGRKRGKQPVSLAKIMQYYIQPTARRVGIKKKIGWHTLRHSFASSLHRNGEGIKVVQELLRHSSARITLDIYAHAVSADKRKAQSRVLADFMPELTSA
jgi:integrase